MNLIKSGMLLFVLFVMTDVQALSGETWMSDRAASIESKPLNALFIPGSHDAGTYNLELEFAKNQDVPTSINYLRWVVGLGYIIAEVAKTWSKTQDSTILQQLNAGVRFLDLRISYRDNKNDFYIVHGLYGPSVSSVLAQIKAFTVKHPQEILIVQMSHFDYMPQGDESHRALIALIDKQLGDSLVTKEDVINPALATLRELWDKKRQVIVIYENSIVHESNTMWPADLIYSYWANAQKVDDLKSRLDNELATRGNYPYAFYVVQSQLTPTTDTIRKSLGLFAEYYSLKDMADAVQKHFPAWLNDWKITPAIIITDFTDASVVEKIVTLNENQPQ